DVPSASVTFSSSTTMATTEFDPASNEWKTVVPSSARAGNVFLAGLGFQVPVDFPGGGEDIDELRSGAPGDTPGDGRRRAGAGGVERAAYLPARGTLSLPDPFQHRCHHPITAREPELEDLSRGLARPRIQRAAQQRPRAVQPRLHGLFT